jgi:hypothetical protein
VAQDVPAVARWTPFERSISGIRCPDLGIQKSRAWSSLLTAREMHLASAGGRTPKRRAIALLPEVRRSAMLQEVLQPQARRVMDLELLELLRGDPTHLL